MITLTENVELVPHFEIIPKHFRADKSDFKPRKKNKKNKKSTQKQRREQVEQERLAYWQDSLKQVGIKDDIPLLLSYGWHVALDDINHDSLYQYVLSVRRKDSSDKSNVWGGILHSDLGGLSLCVDGDFIYQAMCCSDLSNISDWRRAVDDKNQTWKMLWNGHPWLHSRYQDRQIRLTSLNARPPFKGKYAIDPQYFNQVVSRAEKRLAYFKKRIMTY